jgi:hypothetical protein
MSYPIAKPASKEYAYVDPKKAIYGVGQLPEVYHPLDVWNTLGKEPEKMSNYMWQLVFGFAIGAGGNIISNTYAGLPKYAQLHRTLGYGAVGVTLAFLLNKWYKRKHALRDAAIQYYLETHYDDFPLVRRRKLKDEFQTWYPIR